MTEKILPYDRGIVPQETGYWCGPAATQVVLNSRGIRVAEADLARQIGTTTRGTDYVGLIERVLDNIVPDARYTSVYLQQDPPTPGQKEALWANLKRSIDAGFGVVMNWVAPPSNKPRGVKGSVSPRYSGGTTYHYVAAMGYDDGPVARAVWIADSGFQPQGYWVSFDQAASLIPPKGYAYADVAPAPGDPITPTTPTPSTNQVSVLAQVMSPSVVARDRFAALLPAVAQCLAECGCTTAERIAMWAAQIGHESAGLRYMEEIADGSAYNGRTDLGNTQPGDGPRFKGRGPIQVTGRNNYTSLSRWAHGKGLVPTPTFFVDDPAQLASDRYGFIGVTWYWTTQRPMNDYADRRDIEGGSRAVNGTNPKTGRANGIEERIGRYQRALAMGNQLLALTTTQPPIDPIEELLMSDLRVPSLSIYANPGEPPVPIVDMIRALDAHGPHEPYVENQARKGDPDSLRRVVRTAAGNGPYGAAAFAVNQARDVLAEIERTNPEVLQQFLNTQKGA